MVINYAQLEYSIVRPIKDRPTQSGLPQVILMRPLRPCRRHSKSQHGPAPKATHEHDPLMDIWFTVLCNDDGLNLYKLVHHVGLSLMGRTIIDQIRITVNPGQKSLGLRRL
jgi:hypothetical protein